MKVKTIIFTSAICSALIATQAVVAEEQLSPAKEMSYAFDSGKGSSARMAELSGSEMEATEGAAGTLEGMWAEFLQTILGPSRGEQLANAARR